MITGEIIPLQAIPNQTFTIQLDNSLYVITIKFVINIMTVTIIRDNVLIISNVRAIPEQKIIPYRYLEAGNFIITTENNEYPIYSQFGLTQYLVYLTQSELEELRANN